MNFWMAMTGFWIATLVGLLFAKQWVAVGPALGAIAGCLAASTRR